MIGDYRTKRFSFNVLFYLSKQKYKNIQFILVLCISYYKLSQENVSYECVGGLFLKISSKK